MAKERAHQLHIYCFLTVPLSLCMATAALAASEDGLVPNSPEVRAQLPAGEAGYAILPLSPMLKLRPDQLPPAPPVEEVQLDAARGEAESLQVLLTPVNRDFLQVVVTAELRNQAGQVLPIELERLGYVPVAHPTAVGFKTPGRYPDPLFPLRPFDVPLGESGGVWLTVRVPVQAAVGEYRGEVRFAPANAPSRSLPLTLRVHDVTLPTPGYLRSLVLVYDGIPWYKDRWPEALESIFARLLKERFTPTWLGVPWDSVFRRDAGGHWQADWTAFDVAVEGWLAKGATTFWVPWEPFGVDLALSDDPAVLADAAAKLRLLDEHIVARGWQGRFYRYAFDEPSPDSIPAISRYCAFIRQHAPHLVIPMTSSLQGLQGTGTAWVPHIHELDSPAHTAFLARQRARGDEVWMYTCMGTRWSKHPDTWRIDNYGASHRAVGWVLWRFGCDAYLYWNATYWKTGSGESEKLYDLLADPVIINDTNYPDGHCNGDGFLFYPDPAGQDLPYPSVRLAITRDGFEDYDLLRLLEERVRAIRADPVLHERVGPERLSRALDLLTTEPLVMSAGEYEHDSLPYEQRHRQMLEILSDLTR